MTTKLHGKWIWLWNWPRCDAGDPDRVARRLLDSGCRGALVKAFDGANWFSQGRAWRDIAADLHSRGVAAGGWGYLYGRDPAGEAQRAIETASYGQADLLVLDVETEFKGHPEAAAQVCQRIREALGPDYPLYFSTFAIGRYHRAFPYEPFRDHCTGTAPQVYWNAFRWPLDQSLGWTYEDYAALGIPPEQVFPVGGLYQEGFVRYPDAADVQRFIKEAAARGSRGVSFWSYEHMSEEMWKAVAGAQISEAEEESPMSSREYELVTASISQLSTRVDRLESAVKPQPTPVPGPAPKPRTYTVQPGDTLSAIAAKLGLANWQRLYDANSATIGPNPNLIRPGQVLVVP